MKIKIRDHSYEYPKGTKYLEIARDFQEQEENDIILFKVNGELKELFHSVHEDCEVEFITTATSIGHDTYVRSAIFLMVRAAYDVFGPEAHVNVVTAFDQAYYCTVDTMPVIDKEKLALLETKMWDYVRADKPIYKREVKTRAAQKIFASYGQDDKARLFRYRMASTTKLYRLDDYEDYYYGYMAASTGAIKYFRLLTHENGFVLQIPDKSNPKTIPDYVPQKKILKAVNEAIDWGAKSGISYVGDMNELISNGGINELVLVQEALQEKKIAEIAEKIAERQGVKVVLLAGPTSSGKTSTANRICIQLKAVGIRPHLISTDNYFVNREDTPLDENGDYDFECLEALDTKTMNRDLNALLRGEEVPMPTFNFKKGQREYTGETLKLGERDILLIEGIHSLNDEMTYDIPKEAKFKIYVSALHQLNIDEHNRIPSNDGRLIRRIVRDARTRGYSAKDTIARWPSVKRGEEKYIFPYQETADVIFNSSLVYELAVLKNYCVPLLHAIPYDEPEYTEAKRLLKFFEYFLGFGSDHIPNNSLLREFVGGSCFNV